MKKIINIFLGMTINDFKVSGSKQIDSLPPRNIVMDEMTKFDNIKNKIYYLNELIILSYLN